MGKVFDSLGEILSKSINLKLWAYFVLVLILGLVLFGVDFCVTLLPAFAVLILTNFSFAGIVIAVILGIIFLILMVFFSAIIECIALNLARDYLEKGELSWGNAWVKGKSRIFAIFKVQFLIGIILGILFVLLMLPAIGYFLAGLKSVIGLGILNILTNQAQLGALLLTAFLPALIWFIIGIIIYFLIILFLNPILLVIKQVALWEQKGTIEILRRAIQLGKENYWANFAFFILYLILIIVIALVFTAIQLPFNFLASMPVLAIAIIGIIIGFILYIVQMIWLGTLGYLFDAKIYLMDIAKDIPAIAKPLTPMAPVVSRMPMKRASSLAILAAETKNVYRKPASKAKTKTKRTVKRK